MRQCVPQKKKRDSPDELDVVPILSGWAELEWEFRIEAVTHICFLPGPRDTHLGLQEFGANR